MKRYTRVRKRSKKNTLVTEADSWVRAIVFAKQGTDGNSGLCAKCGLQKLLQAAHIFSKGSHPSLRYDLDNVIGLCLRCHIFWAHRDPVAFVDWVEQKYPGRVDQLRLAAQMPRKIDLKELICVLKSIHKALT